MRVSIGLPVADWAAQWNQVAAHVFDDVLDLFVAPRDL